MLIEKDNDNDTDKDNKQDNDNDNEKDKNKLRCGVPSSTKKGLKVHIICPHLLLGVYIPINF